MSKRSGRQRRVSKSRKLWGRKQPHLRHGKRKRRAHRSQGGRT